MKADIHVWPSRFMLHCFQIFLSNYCLGKDDVYFIAKDLVKRSCLDWICLNLLIVSQRNC